MGKSICAVCAAIAVGAVAEPLPTSDPARVDEIAALLPEKPGTPAPAASDRSAWKAAADLPEAKKAVRRAESLLKEPVPELGDYGEFLRTGNRTHYDKDYQRRAGRLEDLVLAECLECRGRFLPAIERYARAICDERSWSSPAHDRTLTNWNGTQLHGDLGVCTRAMVLGYMTALLGDRLPDDLVARVKGEIDRRLLAGVKRRANGDPAWKDWFANGWMDCRSNWNAVCTCGTVLAALSTVEDRRERAWFVEFAERAAGRFLEGFTPDGYCSEGMGYWNFGYGHYLLLGLTIRQLTDGKVDLFRFPRARIAMEYPYGFQLESGKSPHFADGGGAPGGWQLALGRHVWPDLTNEKARACPILDGPLPALALRAFGQEPPPAKAARDVLPIRSWFPDAQVLVSRLKAERRKDPTFAIALKGGHNNEMHNHNDVGSFSIMLNGVLMTGDVGGEVYTKRTFGKDRYVAKVLSSYGHPVPRVGGILQGTGRKFAATVVKSDFTDDVDTLVLDLTKAYPVTNLVSLVRTMTFDRKASRVTVADKVKFSSPAAFESPFMTVQDVFADYDPSHLQLKTPDGGQTLDVDIAATGGAWEFRTELVENPLRVSPKRCAVVFREPVREGETTFVFRRFRDGKDRESVK